MNNYTLKIEKVIAALPSTLTANTLYIVRAGAGVDLYITDMTGSVAHKHNGVPQSVLDQINGNTTSITTINNLIKTIGDNNYWSVVEKTLTSTKGGGYKTVLGIADEYYRINVTSYLSGENQQTISNALGYAEALNSGDDFVLSFEALSTSKLPFTVITQLGSSTTIYTSGFTFNNTWTHYEIPLKVGGASTTLHSFAILLKTADGWSGSSQYDIRRLRLQKGTKASGYQKSAGHLLSLISSKTDLTTFNNFKKHTENSDNRFLALGCDPISETWINPTGIASSNIAESQAKGGYIYYTANDYGVWARTKQTIAFDVNKLYKITFKVKTTTGAAGSATYYGVEFWNADKTSIINKNNTTTTQPGSGSYTSIVQTDNTYKTVEVYVKGRNTGASTGTGTIEDPIKAPGSAFWLNPIVVISTITTSQIYIDYILCEEADILELVNTKADKTTFTKTINGLVPAPTGSTSTRYLREDGTWVVPTDTTYSAGTGITITGNTIAAVNNGTVTSVGLTTPTGFSVTNSPITNSGNIGLSYASGYQGFLSADKTKLDGIENNANNYVLPASTSTVSGGSKLFTDVSQTVAANSVTTTAARTYGIQNNASNQLVVNVPWTNTTYTASTGLTLTSTAFSVKYGTISGTAVEGNDSRVTNGQTAYTWGDHASVGYALSTQLSDYILSSQRGVANGIATLDSSGLIPNTQLPSYVDDVLEFTNLAAFPTTGESGKIYVAQDTNKTYRWGGSSYTYITSGAVDSVAGKTGVVTLVKGDVGLSNVDNTTDASKNVLSATKLTTTRTVAFTGDVTGTNSFDGSSNISTVLTMPTSGVVAGTYGAVTTSNTTTYIPRITVNSKGVVTSVVNTSMLVASTTDYGLTKLYDGYDSTSTVLAPTAKSLKDVADLKSNKTDVVYKYLATTESNPVARYKDVGLWQQRVSSSTGAVVIHLPTSKFKSTTMLTLKISGYNYQTNSGAWNLIVGGYNYTSGWLQYSAGLTGAAPFSQVQLAFAADHAVIILGTETTTWAYPYIHISDLYASYSNITGWDSGITFAIESDLSVYTLAVTPTLYGTERVKSSEKLVTPRTISITGDATWSSSFDGSGNISSNITLSNTGVTAGAYNKLTVNSKGLVLSGTNSIYGMVSADTSTALLSNTSTNSNTYISVVETTDGTRVNAGSSLQIEGAGTVSVGSSGGKITVTGSNTITGNAATATTLQTARTIALSGGATGTATSFNGGANITIPVTSLDATKLAGTATINTTGNAATATKLSTARTISMTGDVTGSVSFDGSANVLTAGVLSETGVTAGTYKSVTVDAKGRVTAGDAVTTGLVTSNIASGVTNVATTNANTYLNLTEKVGTATASTGTSTQIAGAGTVSVASDTAGKITITGAQTITGNSGSATKLETARTINGVSFDGTGNITVADSTKLPLTGGTLTGALTIPSVGTSWIAGTGGASALKLPASTATSWHPWVAQNTSTGNSFAIGQLGETWSLSYATKANIDASNNATSQLLSATASGISIGVPLTAEVTGNATTATRLQTARTIGGVSFNGSVSINLPGVNTIGNQDTTGNSASATKLQTARTIGGVSFDGTASINLPGVNAAGNQSTTGNAGTATALQTARTIGLSGAATGTATSFNGSANITIPVTALDASSLSTGTLPDARLSGIYTGFTHKIDGSNTIFTTPSPGSNNSSGRTIFGLAEYRHSLNTATGAIVFIAPFARSTTVMKQIEIDGMIYSPSQIVKLVINNYSTNITKVISYGSVDVQVRVGETAEGMFCVILGDVTSVWSYPHFTISKAQFSHSVTDAHAYGWSTKLETDLSGYLNLYADISRSALETDISGNSGTATKLGTARTISLSGDATGSTSYDGSANSTLALTLANTGITAGTYKSITVDAKGRATTGNDVITGLVTSTASTGVTNVATTNTNTYLNITEKVGTATATAGASTQITGAGTVTVTSDTAGKLTITGAQTITGNAATATKLATARTINGVSFDGTANITVTDSTKITRGAYGLGLVNGETPLTVDATTIDDNATWYSGIARYTDAALPGTYGHVLRIGGGGLGTSGGWFNDIAFTTGGLVSSRFRVNGSPWGGWITHITSGNIGSQTVAAADKLSTARTIQGVSFDGSANITLPTFSTSGDGLVPARVGATTTKYLREDGTWVTPTNTTYSAITQAEADAGTATTGRLVTAAVLKGAVLTHAPTTNSTQLAKAWVNFDGTSTVTIRKSFNVSSITDNATGKYTINFATAMDDVNYAVTGTTKRTDNTTGGTDNQSMFICPSQYTTSGFHMICNGVSTIYDCEIVNVVVYN